MMNDELHQWLMNYDDSAGLGFDVGVMVDLKNPRSPLSIYSSYTDQEVSLTLDEIWELRQFLNDMFAAQSDETLAKPTMTREEYAQALLAAEKTGKMLFDKERVRKVRFLACVLD